MVETCDDDGGVGSTAAHAAYMHEGNLAVAACPDRALAGHALALPLLSTASEPCAAPSPARQLKPMARHRRTAWQLSPARHLRPVWQLTPVPRQPRPHNKYIECTKPLYAWYQMAMTLNSPSPNHCFKTKRRSVLRLFVIFSSSYYIHIQ